MRTTTCILISVLVVSGCSTFEFPIGGSNNKPPECVVVQDNVEYLREIADSLGVKKSSAKTPSDLATDIKIAISDGEVKMPRPLPDETISEINKILSPDEIKQMAGIQSALKTAQGKKVLFLLSEN